ncbi:type VII secretion integral membrane protein EccD [Actinokineospora spheciospongiae]|uniref:type VII secretion integral membrane protein EccD n=1 Tax=Actinokineospora spheciospongiae TaxID=909613 RepID=UPI000D719B03|nr:type VII secretion integral membrane protein EccD [Actinokineospora spheciospongiae]PWW63301.1 type VII secretion integral membrane protein EccD [Actinokineospora spheciospongiae]
MEEQTQHRTTTAVRLRFVLGKKATDVALPADVPLTDLLPAVLPQFGAEWIEQGADHEGWVVQRVGEPPLDEDRTLAELQLLDGDTVHFRPRADELAAIDFDDLVDGVGEQVREHPGAWNAARTRVLLRVVSGAALVLGVLLVPGVGAVGLQALVAGVVAVLLLGASALVARGAAKPQPATVLAGACAVYAALGGDLLVRVLSPESGTMVRLTAAAAAALVALAAGVVAVADSALLFAGALLFTGVLAVTGLIGSLAEVTGPQAVAIGLTLTLLAGAFVPSTAFRLSGLTLPMLPGGADELSEDIDPVPHKVVIERGAATVGYSTALHTGLGLAQSVLVPFLVVGGHGWSMVLSLVMAFLLLLRSRHPSGLAARWAFVVPALVVVVTNLLHVGAEQTGGARLLVVFLPVLVVGLLLLLAGERLPGRRLRPYWGRAVEILESVTAIAVVPILLQVLGVYAAMRGLAG